MTEMGKKSQEAAIELKQLKKELKDWEHEFATKEGRKPSKQDISQDKEISRRYKLYAKLKAALDETGDGEVGIQKEQDPAEAAPAPEANITKLSSSNIKKPSSKKTTTAAEDAAVAQEEEANQDQAKRPISAKKKTVAIKDHQEEESSKSNGKSETASNGKSSTTNKSSNQMLSPSDAETKAPVSSPRKKSSGGSADYVSSAKRSTSKNSTSGTEKSSSSTSNSQNNVTSIATTVISVKTAEYERPLSPSQPTQSLQSSNPVEDRAWGASSGLPENFRIRKSTIPTGPMPTAGPAASIATKKFVITETNDRSEAPVSPILNPSSGAFMPSNLEKRTFENETNGFYPQNEFTDFMNRRKEVETYTTANATTSSSSARPASPSKITIVNSKPIMSAPATPIQISVKPSMPSPDPSSHMIDERALKKAAYRASIESLEIALPSDPVQAYIPPPVQQHQQQQKKKETAVGDSPLQDRPAPPKRGAFGGDIQVKTSKDSLASRDSLLKSNAGNSAAESNSNSAPPTPASIEATPKPPVRSSLLNINTSKQNLNSNNNKDVNALKSPAAPKDDKDMDDEKEEDMKNAISPSPMATTAKDTAPISAVSPPSPSSLAPVTAAANSAAAATAATGAPATTGSTPSTAVVPAGDTQGLGLNCKSPLAVGLKIFKRIPQDNIIRCRVFRKKVLMDKIHPTFFMYNEGDDKFVMAARKKRKSKSVNYIISSSPDDLSKDSKHYIAKLKANAQRTNFVLYDARYYNKKSEGKGLKEIACVSYSKTVLPREVNAAIPCISIEENENGITKDIMADVKSQNNEKLTFLRNKPPRWNEATQSHCLNFGGRVTLPSIKNFQLIAEKDEATVVMQFGRCGPEYFTLDARGPMTPLTAFAIALTSFDAYDNA